MEENFSYLSHRYAIIFLTSDYYRQVTKFQFGDKGKMFRTTDHRGSVVSESTTIELRKIVVDDYLNIHVFFFQNSLSQFYKNFIKAMMYRDYLKIIAVVLDSPV